MIVTIPAPGIALAARAATTVRRAIDLIETWAAPVLQFAIRLWIARVFFNSGLTKIQDWDATLFLFQEEYRVPLLPTSVAAVMGTTCELAMPVLLVIGLMTRLAALPLIGISLVIQFVLGASNPAYDNAEHIYWIFLLLVIAIRGPGRISLDHLLFRWIESRRS
ncbi:DoxX family protein [Inquilinus limosus]|uniref:DoxX family protein n=1 Tax=Inquilinus limosus TaxID=171674 RepID=UPI003F16533E